MAISNPSCTVASPRECNYATENLPATSDATGNAATASKPASIKELREQLKAQLACNQHKTEKAGIEAELHEVLDWLHRIEETDPETIECTLEACRMDIDALDYFLGRARE